MNSQPPILTQLIDVLYRRNCKRYLGVLTATLMLNNDIDDERIEALAQQLQRLPYLWRIHQAMIEEMLSYWADFASTHGSKAILQFIVNDRSSVSDLEAFEAAADILCSRRLWDWEEEEWSQMLISVLQVEPVKAYHILGTYSEKYQVQRLMAA